MVRAVDPCHMDSHQIHILPETVQGPLVVTPHYFSMEGSYMIQPLTLCKQFFFKGFSGECHKNQPLSDSKHGRLACKAGPTGDHVMEIWSLINNNQGENEDGRVNR